MRTAVPIVRWQLGRSSFMPMVGMGGVRLAEGPVSAPRVTLGAMKDFIDAVAEAIDRELEALIVEADLVSPSALRADPSSPYEISEIGELPPGEIRSSISAAARELSSRLDRVMTGVLRSYLSPDQQAVLHSEKARADSIVSAMANQDVLPIPPADQASVENYIYSHLSAPDEAILKAEKAMVSAEAGSVPVFEPGEKGLATNIAIGVGLVTVTGLVLWSVLA